MTVDYTTPRVPVTPADREMILQELHAIVSSHLFKNSKRYPTLLKYVVHKTLDGHADQLKERTLGVEVFDRPPDYDTNADPVVRVSAGEIRRRIAQFYHENGKNSRLQIDLPIGSYVPEFKLRVEPLEGDENLSQRVEAGQAFEASPAVIHQAELDGYSGDSNHAVRKRNLFLRAAIVLIAVAGVGAYAIHETNAQTQSDRIWGPVLKSPGSVLFVIGNGPHGLIATSSEEQAAQISKVHGAYDHISFNEAVSLSHLTDVMAKGKKQYEVKEADLATLQDMHSRPVVFIGAYNNLWTMRLVEGLRFHFEKDGRVVRIIDAKYPGNREWAVDYTQPYASALYDYAVIARYTDPTTNGHAMIVAGIGAYGTQAASEALSNPADLERLLSSVPAGWESKNLEIVIKTAIINGEAARPTLVSAATW